MHSSRTSFNRGWEKKSRSSYRAPNATLNFYRRATRRESIRSIDPIGCLSECMLYGARYTRDGRKRNVKTDSRASRTVRTNVFRTTDRPKRMRWPNEFPGKRCKYDKHDVPAVAARNHSSRISFVRRESENARTNGEERERGGRERGRKRKEERRYLLT